LVLFSLFFFFCFFFCQPGGTAPRHAKKFPGAKNSAMFGVFTETGGKNAGDPKPKNQSGPGPRGGPPQPREFVSPQNIFSKPI